jgi:hypothetical protein
MNESNFIYKPLAIVQDKRLTPLEQDYLCLIAQLEKADGCTASNQYFADYFGVKRQTAQGNIGKLKTKGVINSTEKKQGGKTIERTIVIIDSISRNVLLLDSRDNLPKDSRKPPVGIAGNSDKDSRKPPTPTIDTTIEKTTDNSFSPNSIEFRLANLLLQVILKRKPDFRKLNIQQWAKHIDAMIRLDKRTPEQIEGVIRWTQQDPFWQNNILSTAKLREKFDQLEMKKNASKQNKRSESPARPNYR